MICSPIRKSKVVEQRLMTNLLTTSTRWSQDFPPFFRSSSLSDRGIRRQIGIITVDMGFIFAYANVTANIYESSGFRVNVLPWKMQRVCLRFLKAYLCTFSLQQYFNENSLNLFARRKNRTPFIFAAFPHLFLFVSFLCFCVCLFSFASPREKDEGKPGKKREGLFIFFIPYHICLLLFILISKPSP